MWPVVSAIWKRGRASRLARPGNDKCEEEEGKEPDGTAGEEEPDGTAREETTDDEELSGTEDIGV